MHKKRRRPRRHWPFSQSLEKFSERMGTKSWKLIAQKYRNAGIPHIDDQTLDLEAHQALFKRCLLFHSRPARSYNICRAIKLSERENGSRTSLSRSLALPNSTPRVFGNHLFLPLFPHKNISTSMRLAFLARKKEPEGPLKAEGERRERMSLKQSRVQK